MQVYKTFGLDCQAEK